MDTTSIGAILGTISLLEEQFSLPPKKSKEEREKREREEREMVEYVMRMYHEVLKGDWSNISGLFGAAFVSFRLKMFSFSSFLLKKFLVFVPFCPWAVHYLSMACLLFRFFFFSFFFFLFFFFFFLFSFSFFFFSFSFFFPFPPFPPLFPPFPPFSLFSFFPRKPKLTLNQNYSKIDRRSRMCEKSSKRSSRL